MAEFANVPDADFPGSLIGNGKTAVGTWVINKVTYTLTITWDKSVTFTAAVPKISADNVNLLAGMRTINGVIGKADASKQVLLLTLDNGPTIGGDLARPGIPDEVTVQGNANWTKDSYVDMHSQFKFYLAHSPIATKDLTVVPQRIRRPHRMPLRTKSDMVPNAGTEKLATLCRAKSDSENSARMRNEDARSVGCKLQQYVGVLLLLSAAMFLHLPHSLAVDM